MRPETNATSPPGVMSSWGAPVHAEFGGRDLRAVEARREGREGWKGGFVRVNVRLEGEKGGGVSWGGWRGG